MKRPTLNDRISLEDFKNFYWLKEELTTFCKTMRIDASGGKIDITERIIEFLSSGQTIKRIRKTTPKPDSNFDWNSHPLTPDTIINSNYKNTEHVRAFFITQIGPHFHFYVEFMRWMKQNSGETLHTAIVEWVRLYNLKKDQNHKTEIAPQFEYNQYMRDFFDDNPNLTAKDAMKIWKLKRALPGNNKYSPSDLALKEDLNN